MPLLTSQALPSSSKNSEGSMPSYSSQTGSDHGPAGSYALMMKLPMPRPGQ